MSRLTKAGAQTRVTVDLAKQARAQVNTWIQDGLVAESMDSLVESTVARYEAVLRHDIELFRATCKYPQYCD